MICNKCGNNCKDNEKFCGTCGNDLIQQNNMNVVNNSMFNNQIPPVYNQQPVQQVQIPTQTLKLRLRMEMPILLLIPKPPHLL